MAIIITVIVIVSLLLGAWAGYYWGTWFIRQENMTLRKQNALLQQFADHWAAQSTDRMTLSQQIAQQNNSNAAATIGTVIQLLHTFQAQEAHRLKQEDQQAIDAIIGQARAIAPTSENE